MVISAERNEDLLNPYHRNLHPEEGANFETRLVAGPDLVASPLSYPLELHPWSSWTFSGVLPRGCYTRPNGRSIIGLSTRSKYGQIGFDCMPENFVTDGLRFDATFTNLSGVILKLDAGQELKLGKTYTIDTNPLREVALNDALEGIQADGEVLTIQRFHNYPFDLLSIPTPYLIKQVMIPNEINLMQLPDGTDSQAIRRYLIQDHRLNWDPDIDIPMNYSGVTIFSTGPFRLPINIGLLIVAGENNGKIIPHTSSRLLMPTDPGGLPYTHPIIAEYLNFPGGRAIDTRMLCLAYTAKYHT